MSNPDTFISFPSLSTWEKLHYLHFEVWEHWNWQNSSMLFFDVFPKWFVAPLLVYIINILRTSLEYILPSFSSIFWLKLETAHHAFDLIAQSSFPTHPKLPSNASEAFFSFAVLFCTFARDSAAQLLPNLVLFLMQLRQCYDLTCLKIWKFTSLRWKRMSDEASKIQTLEESELLKVNRQCSLPHSLIDTKMICSRSIY